MKNYFNRILVPVLFNGDTTETVKQAVAVANELACDILLLHVINSKTRVSFFKRIARPGQFESCESRMRNIVEEFRPELRDGLLMNYSVQIGSWQAIVKDIIIAQHIDLLVLPGQSRSLFEKWNGYLDVNKLSQQTKCPVLSVTSDFRISKLHDIVVPVSDFLPIRKLTAATYLARKFNGVVHLLGQTDEVYTKGLKKSRHLAKAYQLLRDYTNVKVYCTSAKSNASNDALAYANSVQADLIVVNPGKETGLSGWFSKWMGNLYDRSNIPVLTIY